MIAAIAWKEWRQQVALVIAILALAGIVLAATAMTMPHEWAMRSGHISNGIMWVVLLIGLAFTQGLVTGAMLFAGETEERTQEFLDQHIGLRSPLWRAKMLSGVSLVGASSVVLGGLIVVLDTPHFVKTDAEGHFKLGGLPPGSYKLKAWLDSKTTLERAVELKAGSTLRADLP